MASWDTAAPSGSSNAEGAQRDDGQDEDEPTRGGEENDAAGRTPMRRRKDEKYQAFEQEEKELLKKYEKSESKARAVLFKTHQKLLDGPFSGNMFKRINYLKERMEALKLKTSLEPILIGFLGRTGAGKTSLLNAIIGKKLFLPVSGSQTCTSCVVQVKRSRSEEYEAIIHLLSEEEWRDELKDLVELLRNDTDGEEEAVSLDECVSDATDKLRALYGPGAERKSYGELLNAKLRVAIPARRTIRFQHKEVDQFSKQLEPYIRVRNDGSVAHWPLIKHVELTIPGSDLVPEGITFVDIPGTGDFNSKRDEMWKQNIGKCSVLWIVSDMERTEGEKVQKVLLKESIQAYLAGNCTDLTLVVTKSDKLDLDEYEKERTNKNTPIGNEHDSILERNAEVKRSRDRRIREALKKQLPSDSELIHKRDLVYTVSAKEFWNKRYLSEEETEIPELRKCIRRLFLKEKRRLVMTYVKKILGIHLLVKNISCRDEQMEQCFQEGSIENFVNYEIEQLGKKIDSCFSQIEQPLCDGVKQAKKSYGKIIKTMLLSGDGYQGSHRTMKAVCRKNGVYASKTFARIDFNENLARPIYDNIGSCFGSIFRTQSATRANLWFQLEQVIRNVQEKAEQIAKESRIPDKNGKISAFAHELNIILLNLKEWILQRKPAIFASLQESIQNDLKPHYAEASRINGQKCCDRMKNTLSKGIEEEVKNLMFEKAKSQMNAHFLELKEEIMRTLKTDISIALDHLLLPQDLLAVFFPDIEQEYREIKGLHDALEHDD